MDEMVYDRSRAVSEELGRYPKLFMVYLVMHELS